MITNRNQNNIDHQMLEESLWENITFKLEQEQREIFGVWFKFFSCLHGQVPWKKLILKRKTFFIDFII